MPNQRPRAGLVFWLQERGRDVLLWPVNLFCDFPMRISRVLWTARSGLRGFAGLPVELWWAIRRRELASWANRLPGRQAQWLHQLLNELFDLAGGPELAQFFTHLITNTTPLTPAEIALAISVMGSDRIRLDRVRVAEGGLQDLIFKYNGNLAYTTWHTVHLPRETGDGRIGHSRTNLDILIHELAHVYQYEQVGSRYLGEAIYMLVRSKRDCYDYGAIQGLEAARAAGRRYRDFNREQQAQIVQDYFALRRLGRDVSAFEPFIAELRSGQV